MARTSLSWNLTRYSASATAVERGLLHWLLGTLRGQERTFERILGPATDRMGAVLLGTKNAEEFDCGLLGLLEDEPAADGYFLVVDALQTLKLDAGPLGPQLRPEVRTSVGEVVEATLLRTFPVLDAAHNVVEQLLSAQEDHAAKQPEFSTLGEWLAGLDVPPAIYSLLSQCVLGHLALMALINSVLQRVQVPDWSGALCAERLVDGSRALLRLFISFTSVEIAQDLLPRSERLDFAVLTQEYEEGKLGLKLLRLEHQASGRPRSFPFGGPVDDE
jgi:hypothetical protein